MALKRAVCIGLLATPSAISAVVALNNAQGRITGIDIDNAAHKVDLREIVLSRIPAGLTA